jgi:hypothetical protein
MKKASLVLMLVGLLVAGCGGGETEPQPETDMEKLSTSVAATVYAEFQKEEPTATPEVIEATSQVEATQEVKSSEVGPWTIQQSITQVGQYLVPEEMQPGQWAYQADDPSDECWAITYSDLSGSKESRLDYFYSENKGFFVLKENVRMVELKFGPCTWNRIGD